MECEDRGDIGVRFDRLNELRGRKVSNPTGCFERVERVLTSDPFPLRPIPSPSGGGLGRGSDFHNEQTVHFKR